MTMYDVYVGDLTEGSWTERGWTHAFTWEGGARARALGGTDALWNLQTLCQPCNTRKAVEEGRLSLERSRPAVIVCAVARCPWCGDRPRDRSGARGSIGRVAVPARLPTAPPSRN